MNKVDAHRKICEELNALYARKNADYGDSFGKSYKEYGLASVCMRLDDKLNRLKSLRKKEALVADESIGDTLIDLANYAIMTLVEMRVDEPVVAEDDFEEIVDEFPDLPKVGDHEQFCVEHTPSCLCNSCRRDDTDRDEPCCVSHQGNNCLIRYCPDYIPDYTV